MNVLPHFAFRQRCGPLNWKDVSSVDIEELIQKVNLGELQGLLDSLAFCQLTASEISRQPPENVTKACQLMQYIIEYMLHCQETQSETILETESKNEILINKYNRLKQRYATVYEDLKGAKRQIHELMESARSVGMTLYNPNIVPNNNQMRVLIEPQPKKTNNKRNKENEHQIVPCADHTKILMETLQNRERESLHQLKEIMLQQQQCFLQEIASISGATKNETSSVQEAALMGVQQLSELVESYRHTLKEETDNFMKLKVELASQPRLPDGVSIEDIKAAKMLAEEKASFLFEKRVWETEKERARERDRERDEEIANLKLSAQKEPVIVEVLRPLTPVPVPSANDMAGTALISKHKNCLKIVRQTLLVKFNNYNNAHLLQRAVWIWKYNALRVKVDELGQTDNEELSRWREESQMKERETASKLMAEKQKGIVACARYNSSLSKLKAGFEEEIQGLKMRLYQYEEVNKNIDEASLREKAMHAMQLSAIHPIINEATCEEDLYLKLNDKIDQESVLTKDDQTRIMNEIAAEMTQRLQNFETHE